MFVQYNLTQSSNKENNNIFYCFFPGFPKNALTWTIRESRVDTQANRHQNQPWTLVSNKNIMIRSLSLHLLLPCQVVQPALPGRWRSHVDEHLGFFLHRQVVVRHRDYNGRTHFIYHHNNTLTLLIAHTKLVFQLRDRIILLNSTQLLEKSSAIAFRPYTKNTCVVHTQPLLVK